MQFFSDNDDTTPLLQWEAYKCSLHGFLIAKSSAVKKERTAHFHHLLQKIQRLEMTHRQAGLVTDWHKLTVLWRDLSALMNHSYQRAFTRIKTFFYANVNKCGSLLARMIAKNRSHTYIAKIHDKDNYLR
ncbi:Hypothetical predicted protein, partial [Pelobates cultripes]